MLQKIGVTAYIHTLHAKQRIHDTVSSFICVFDQSMLNTIIAKTNREDRRVKEMSGKVLDLWKWKHTLVCAFSVQFSKVIRRVFASCEFQLVEDH